MLTSLMYKSPALYRMFMRILYWPHFEDRYSTLADMIPRNASVVDACCGDAYLYLAYLKEKDVRYIGLDSSPGMVKEGRRNNIDVRLWDAWSDPIPRADYVIIQGSLCHFIPHSREIIHKLLSAADKRVLISEPIYERPRRKNPLSNWLSRLFTTPVGDKRNYSGERFTKASLEKLFIEIPTFNHLVTVTGGAEVIGAFDPHSYLTSPSKECSHSLNLY